MSSFPDGNKHKNPLFSDSGLTNSEILEEAKRVTTLPFVGKLKFIAGFIAVVDIALFCTIVTVRLALSIF